MLHSLIYTWAAVNILGLPTQVKSVCGKRWSPVDFISIHSNYFITVFSCITRDSDCKFDYGHLIGNFQEVLYLSHTSAALLTIFHVGSLDKKKERFTFH